MSFLFGGGDTQPAAVPVSPNTSEAAQAARDAATNAALAESKAAGRASTIVAGQKIAADDQMLKATKGRAASAMLG